MEKIKSLVTTKPGKMEWEMREKATLAKGEVLVKITAAGICGTDIHAWGGTQPFFSYPRVLGHELCGIVADTNVEGQSFDLGQQVTVVPYISCGYCAACENGKTNCCEKISVIGVHQDGGFCESLTVPAENLLAVSNASSETAALIEPFSIGMHAVRRAKIEKGEAVLVVGAGPIGLGIAAISKINGAKVVVADTSSIRRMHAKDKLDLITVDPSSKSINLELSEIFGEALPSTIIDATGNPVAMNNSINFVCHGGTIVFVGLHKGNIVIPDSDFHKKEITLIGSRNATHSDFKQVQDLMTSGQINADIMLNKFLSFSSLAKDFESKIINDKNLIKAVVHFE